MSLDIRDDRRYDASAAMWQHLFSVMDPQRVAIVAPPMVLAFFCNALIRMEAGEFADEASARHPS